MFDNYNSILNYTYTITVYKKVHSLITHLCQGPRAILANTLTLHLPAREMWSTMLFKSPLLTKTHAAMYTFVWPRECAMENSYPTVHCFVLTSDMCALLSIQGSVTYFASILDRPGWTYICLRCQAWDEALDRCHLHFTYEFWTKNKALVVWLLYKHCLKISIANS